MQVLSSASNSCLIELNAQAIQNVPQNQGLRLEGGRLQAFAGATTPEAAQTVKEVVHAKFSEIDSIAKGICSHRGRFTVEDRQRIVTLMKYMEGIKTGCLHLRGYGENPLKTRMLLDEAGQEVEQAEQLLRSLREQALNIPQEEFPQDVYRAFEVQETKPDSILVEARLAAERASKSSVAAATAEAIEKSAWHAAENCKVIREAAAQCSRAPTVQQTPLLYLTTDGKLTPSKPYYSGNMYGLHGVAQVMYNSCLRRIEEIELSVNGSSIPMQEKRRLAQEGIAELKHLRDSLESIKRKYATDFSIRDSDKEIRGLRALEEAQIKLDESAKKLGALCIGMDAASLHQVSSRSVETARVKARDARTPPQVRIDELRKNIAVLEDMRWALQSERAVHHDLLPDSLAQSELRIAIEEIEEALPEFAILLAELEGLAMASAASPAAMHAVAEEVEAGSEAGISHVETAYLHEAHSEVAKIKEVLISAKNPVDKLAIIARIPQELLNVPEVAELLRTELILLDHIDPMLSNADVQRGRQRLLQRKIDDLMGSCSTTPVAELRAAIDQLIGSYKLRKLEASSYASLCRAIEQLSSDGFTDLPGVGSTMYAGDEVEAFDKRIAMPHVEAFWTIAIKAPDCVLQTAQDFEKVEKARLSGLLDRAARISTILDTDKMLSPQRIIELRRELHQISLALKKQCDAEQGAIFSKLQAQLSQMAVHYNSLVQEREKLLALGVHENDPRIRKLLYHEHEMLAMIDRFNLIFGNASLTTNTATVVKGHVIDFVAVVEKRLDLLEKSFHPPSPQEGEQVRLELAKCPSASVLAKSAASLQSEIAAIATTNPHALPIVDASEAKKLHKRHPELAWGESHLNMALCTPANWTVTRTALIKQSRSGRVHVAVSINEPLDIEESGGVPAGLRGDPGFSHRPANLMRTTAYLCLDNGSASRPTHVSFRGGQFPTVAAAKKALEHILDDPNLEGATYLHINALLTPTALTLLKADKTLLQHHKENIIAAFDELIREAETRLDAARARRLREIKDHFAVSNCGVNEGAVGQTMLPMYLGWHESILRFCNFASQRLNSAVWDKLGMMERCLASETELPSAEMAAQFDLLGPIVQVGQELEAVFAQNHYADATVGNNQFKMPALWKTLDALVGVSCYTDCMSGKDRTGKVESCAQEYLDEIAMNVLDHKQKLLEMCVQLSKGLTPPKDGVWQNARGLLMSACFTVEDLQRFRQILEVSGEAEFKQAVLASLRAKVATVKTGLGMEASPEGFMRPKAPPVLPKLRPGTFGLETTQPKICMAGRQARGQFVRFAVSSMYAATPDRGASEAEYVRFLENRQREAINRRYSQLAGSLEVTRINTGKPGFKVEGGDPLIKHSCGFDLEYVVYRLGRLDPNDSLFKQNVIFLTGMHELSATQAGAYADKLQQIAKSGLSREMKVAQWTDVLNRIAKDKSEAFLPKAHVKA